MFNVTNNNEEGMNLATKEEEIIDSYNYEDIEDEEIVYEEDIPEDEIDSSSEDNKEEYEEFTEDDSTEKKHKPRNKKRILNIIFIVIIVLLSMIAIDVISVARYDKGPFFAIRLKTYEDGSKAYYGIGYKVIKYNQTQGRRDKELGTWALKYNTEPITMQDIDLAIEMTDNEQQTYQKYYKKFVRIISTLKKVDIDNHQILIGYEDEDGKYSLDIICSIVEDQDDLDLLEVGKEITVIGTVSNFEPKSDKYYNSLYISNCFSEQ